jgi:hypothetical protein
MFANLPHLRSKIAAFALVAGAAALLSVWPSTSADAYYCKWRECVTGASVASRAAGVAPSVARSALVSKVQSDLQNFLQILALLQQGTTNDGQNEANNKIVLNDAMVAANSQYAVAQTRARATLAMAPSRTACATYTRSNRLTTAALDPARMTGYAATQKAALDFSANAPGTPSEKGRLAAETNLFKRLMTGVCDGAVINAPDNVSCTLANDSLGRSMEWRYAQPFLAVFGVKDSLIPTDANNAEHRAARLFAEMAAAPAPDDTLRGAALARSTGKTAHVLRQRDIATVSLARGALDRMVDERVGKAEEGAESVEHLRQKAWDNADEFVQHAKDRAGQPIAANMDDMAEMEGDINKIYLQLYVNLERLAVVKATRLSRLIKANGAPTSVPASFSPGGS